MYIDLVLNVWNSLAKQLRKQLAYSTGRQTALWRYTDRRLNVIHRNSVCLYKQLSVSLWLPGMRLWPWPQMQRVGRILTCPSRLEARGWRWVLNTPVSFKSISGSWCVSGKILPYCHKCSFTQKSLEFCFLQSNENNREIRILEKWDLVRFLGTVLSFCKDLLGVLTFQLRVTCSDCFGIYECFSL